MEIPHHGHLKTAIIHPRKYTHSTCNTGHPVRTKGWYGTVHCGETTAWPCIVWLRDKPHHPQQITACDRCSAQPRLVKRSQNSGTGPSRVPVESPLHCQRILFSFSCSVFTRRVGPGSVDVSCDPHLLTHISSSNPSFGLFIINLGSA